MVNNPMQEMQENPSANTEIQETWVRFLDQEDPLE